MSLADVLVRGPSIGADNVGGDLVYAGHNYVLVGDLHFLNFSICASLLSHCTTQPSSRVTSFSSSSKLWSAEREEGCMYVRT